MANITKSDSFFVKEQEVVLFRISNSSGAYIEITNIGASIVSIIMPDKNGILTNIVLHYNDLKDYLTDSYYLGSTIGRFSNRISDARFYLNGKIYNLDKNDGDNSNHGGFSGFNKKIFDYKVDQNNVTFYIESLDGEGGFSGNLKLWITYTFTDENEVKIEYKAISDRETPVNFTNHTYFNLSGDKRRILECLVKVNAEKYLETNDEFLPTGKILDTKNTAFDFRDYKKIKEMCLLKKDNLEGYNTYFIKNNSKDKILASLKDSTSGRILDVYSSMPGVLFYTGDFLSGKFISFQGLCFEPQYYPDGMNHPHFETNILKPDEEKTDTIVYKFRNE